MRAKIIDGVFTPAPRKIQREIDGEQYVTYNPTDEMLAEQGWLTVHFTDSPKPSEGWHYEPIYIEEGSKIVQDWELVKDSEISDEISDAEALAIMLGGEI